MPVSVFVGVCQFVEVNGSCFSLSLFVSSISYNLNQLLKSMLPLKFLSVGFIWLIRGINRFESKRKKRNPSFLKSREEKHTK